ncbi:hypothetical protein REPUB_Repub07fG0027600 [Reevesia pubescens]
MDSCASVLETPDSGICSKAGQLLLLSPVFLEGELINEDNYVVADMISFKSRTSTTRPMTSSQNIDSEEETFFDSQAWLGSDFEDEFFSVKGKSDNPGTCGSPSQRNSFYVESPPFINAISNPSQEPPPAEEKKKLAELLLDTFWSDLLVQLQHHNVVLIYGEKDLSWSEQAKYHGS